MKPRLAPRSSRSKSQDKHDDNGPRKAKEKRQKTTSCSKQPLSGKVFYLDLPSNKRSETLENDIQTLGGTVEKFFSKDIRYLVSSKPEARHVHRLVRESPVPSPESVLSSPHPSSSKGGHRSSSHGATDPVQISRGKSLVEKVVKEQERIPINKMFSNALEWGVKILHIEEMMAYIEKKKPVISAQQKTNPNVVKKTAKPSCFGQSFLKKKATRIAKPFVKVEDSSRCYRPFYLHMAQMPVCNFNSVPPASPFQVEEKRQTTHGPQGHVGKGKHRLREKRKRGGYCECCGVKYDKLRAHLEGVQHRAFVAGDHYKELDALIAQLPLVFVTDPPPTQRVKCSVPTSPICVSVAGGQTEEAGGSGEGGESRRAQWSPSLSTSCSSRRKRGREPLSGKSPGSSEEEVTDVPESSRSKWGSFKRDSCPTLLRALGESSNLHSDKVSDAVVTERCSGMQRPKGQHHQRRTYRRTRRPLLASQALDRKHTDTLGLEVAPCADLTLIELLQGSPSEAAWHKTVSVTQQDAIQGKPVYFISWDSLQESMHATFVGNPPQDSMQGDPNDFTQQDSIQEKPVDVAQWESMQVKPAGVTRQDSMQGDPKDLMQEDSIQEKPVDVTQWESMQVKPVGVTRQDSEAQSFGTFTPVVSTHQPQQLPVRANKRPADSSDHYPEQTRSATDVPSPAPSTRQDGAGAFSPLRRKVRAERRWRRGRSLCLRRPEAESCGAEEAKAEAEAEAQLGLDLWQLFQESDDVQEDFLGFAD